MLIYRIEHDNNLGPYRSDFDICFALCRAHNADRNYSSHPGIYASGLVDELRDKIVEEFEYTEDTGNWYCGSTSVVKLKKWFRGWWGKLHRNGFLLAVYDVEDFAYAADDKQACFFPKYARKIATYSMMRRSDKIYV